MTRESVQQGEMEKNKGTVNDVSEILAPTSTALDDYTPSVPKSGAATASIPKPQEVARRRIGLQM